MQQTIGIGAFFMEVHHFVDPKPFSEFGSIAIFPVLVALAVIIYFSFGPWVISKKGDGTDADGPPGE